MVNKIRPITESDVFLPGAPIEYWWDYKTHLAKYVFASGFVQGKRVLDIGCGVGYGSSYLLRKGAKSVIAVEISLDAVELAKKHYERPGLEFITHDASTLPFPDSSFDVITCIGMLDHVEDPEKVVSECQRVLCHGGTFLCCLAAKDFITLPIIKKRMDPFHHTEFNPSELSALCGKYFSDIHSYGEQLGRLWYLTVITSSWVGRKAPAIHKIIKHVGKLILRKKLKPLTYSEDMVDVHFSSGSGFIPFELKDQSHFSSFIVIGVKDSL